jgi:hypothetical protein
LGGPPDRSELQAAYLALFGRSGGRVDMAEAQRVELVDLGPRIDKSLTVDKQGEHCMALTCAFEPEVGFEPTTFRLRVGPNPSNWTRPDPSWLLRSGADSI